MRFTGQLSSGQDVVLAPLAPEHDRLLFEAVTAAPYVWDQRWGADPVAFYRLLIEAPNSLFCAVLDMDKGGACRGFTWTSMIHVGWDCWVNGAALPGTAARKALRAMDLMVDLAFRAWDLELVRADVCVANRAVNWILAQLGFKFDGLVRLARQHQGQRMDSIIHSLTREEWHGRRRG